MPFVRIFHAWDDSDEKIAKVSDSVHQAMVETFGIPDDDLFQVASGHRPGSALRISPTFLGITHSADATFIQITCAAGRTPVQKKALYAAIASKVSATTGISTRDVIINLVETSRENWSFGNGLAQFAPE